MQMQRRHFEFIASVLEGLAPGNTEMTKEEHKAICEHFAANLEGTNRAFNKDFFMVASGAQEGTYRNKSR